MKTNELITKIRSVVHCIAPPARELLEQAAEALEQLKVESGKLKVGRWIPVRSRLPEDDAQVLVIVSGRWKNVTFNNAYELASWSVTEGWIMEAWPEFENPDVSHWMPLPEPPEEG